MRIYVFSSSTRFTGGRQVLYAHANELARRGHEVTLFVMADANVQWMALRFASRQITQREIGGLAPADLCLLERPSLVGPLYRARVGIPVLVWQGFEARDLRNRIAQLRGRTDWLLKLPTILRYRARIRDLERAYRTPIPKIAIHRPLADVMREQYGQHVWLVPNGLPPGVFSPPSPPAPRRWDGATVLVVGPSDTAWKRIGDALEAMKLIKQRIPGAKLVRASPHPMRPVEQAVGVTDEFHTMATPEQMAELYRSADVLMIGSDNTEGFGLPVVEAMACGTPVVATDIDAFRGFDAVTDYARFVPVGRPELLAQEVCTILGSADERRRLSAREVEVASQYTMQRSFDAMSQAIAEISAEYAGQFGAAGAAR